MTNKSNTGKPDVSASSQPELGSAQLSVKPEWRRPKLETLAVRETLYGTAPAGADGAGFSPTRV